MVKRSNVFEILTPSRKQEEWGQKQYLQIMAGSFLKLKKDLEPHIEKYCELEAR